MIVYIVCPSDPYEAGWEGIFSTREAAQAHLDSLPYGEDFMCIVEEAVQ